MRRIVTAAAAECRHMSMLLSMLLSMLIKYHYTTAFTVSKPCVEVKKTQGHEMNSRSFLPSCHTPLGSSQNAHWYERIEKVLNVCNTLKPHYNKVPSYTKIGSLYPKICSKGIFLTLSSAKLFSYNFARTNILLYLCSIYRGLSVTPLALEGFEKFFDS